MRYFTIAMFCTAPLAATAQDSITIEAAEGYRFIRCVDMYGMGASCEFLAAGDDMLNCVAFDAEGEPIAVAQTFGDGPALYQGLSAADIDTVICE
jgi:hypothetical protein